ncbi:hypothetical protein CDAR_77331 [Caerostris darwini]|uniref:Uncharacterized protein n=1 Tax=Caerostris darwini TaxID=1538125 RepID=A0AAV4TNS2_9ARAC|nr:hypothetical protein CDAR_77331 [Caerostris darwini]
MRFSSPKQCIWYCGVDFTTQFDSPLPNNAFGIVGRISPHNSILLSQTMHLVLWGGFHHTIRFSSPKQCIWYCGVDFTTQFDSLLTNNAFGIVGWISPRDTILYPQTLHLVSLGYTLTQDGILRPPTNDIRGAHPPLKYTAYIRYH